MVDPQYPYFEGLHLDSLAGRRLMYNLSDSPRVYWYLNLELTAVAKEQSLPLAELRDLLNLAGKAVAKRRVSFLKRYWSYPLVGLLLEKGEGWFVQDPSCLLHDGCIPLGDWNHVLGALSGDTNSVKPD